MTPFLKAGDTVLVFKFLKPKVGDIVVFKFADQKFYIKRISKIKKHQYYLKGDNSKKSIDSREMGWIYKKDIIGKVIYKIETSR